MITVAFTIYSDHKGDTHLVKFIADSRTFSTQSTCGTFVCLVQIYNTARKTLPLVLLGKLVMAAFPHVH